MTMATGSRLGSPSGKTGNIIPKGHKLGQLQQFTPEQQQLFQQMFSQISPSSYTSRLAGGDEDLFGEMEAPAHRLFGQALSQTGNRFSQFSPGAMSAQGGSGFKNQLGSLSSNFAQDLASKRQELQRQAISDLMGMSGTLLGQRPYEQFLTKKKPSFWQSFAGSVAENTGALPDAFAKAFIGQ